MQLCVYHILRKLSFPGYVATTFFAVSQPTNRKKRRAFDSDLMNDEHTPPFNVIWIQKCIERSFTFAIVRTYWFGREHKRAAHLTNTVAEVQIYTWTNVASKPLPWSEFPALGMCCQCFYEELCLYVAVIVPPWYNRQIRISLHQTRRMGYLHHRIFFNAHTGMFASAPENSDNCKSFNKKILLCTEILSSATSITIHRCSTHC